MKLITSDLEIVKSVLDIGGKTVLDVGCGTGTLMRALISEGATTIGLDSNDMIEKALKEKQSTLENYLVCKGEALSIRSGTIDLAVFIASLHHIQKERISDALRETKRVLSPNGRVIFLEPVGQPGSYFELIRLVEDERKIQEHAYRAIKNAAQSGLKELLEETYYLARTFNDYINLLDVFVESPKERIRLLEKARVITERLSKDANVPFESYTYKSICRVNVFGC